MANFFSKLKGLLFGNEGKFSNQDVLNPQQQQLHGQFLNQFGGAQNAGLQNILGLLQGGDEAFAKFEDPYKRQFQQETIPGLAEQFAGMGSGGSQNSSAFQQALGGAGADLSANLASLRGNLQNQAVGQLQGFQNQAYQPTFQTSFTPPTTGLFQGLTSGLSQGVGSYLGNKSFQDGGLADLLKQYLGGGSSPVAPGSAKV
jgi:hypothetical protein